MDETIPPKAAKGLLALVIANLAWNFGISWSLRSEDIRWALLLLAVLFVAVGTLVAQTFVLAVWMSFSSSRWLARVAVPALLLVAFAMASGLGAGAGTLEAAAGAALPLTVLFAILVAMFIPLRRVRGWRLTARPDARPGELGRFRIGDVLIWMVVIAVPLAIVRLFSTFVSAQDVTAGMLAILVSVILMLPLLWLALLASLAPSHRQLWLLAVLVAYAGLATALAAWFVYPWIEPLLWPQPGWFVVSLTCAFFGSGAVIAMLACLALRLLGYRLIRPGWTFSPSDGPHSSADGPATR